LLATCCFGVLNPAVALYTPSQGTLKPSLGAIQAFPTPEYPEKGYTAPRPGLGQKLEGDPGHLLRKFRDDGGKFVNSK
jgi:hypothetical protein